MRVATYEAMVENGQVKLPKTVRLPEHAKVYVVVPEAEEEAPASRIRSPRLARPEQASVFVKEVIQDEADAALR